MKNRMAARCALGFIAALIVFSFLVVAVHAAEPKHEWSKWGVAPYASSFAEACRKAPSAIDGFRSMPQPVREHFKKVLAASCSGSSERYLTPGIQLEEMHSGGSKPHVLQKPIVAELPVLKSPDGRPYRKGSVAEAAKVHEWIYEFEGKTYALDLPSVCFNFAWRFAPATIITATLPVCKTVEYTVKASDEIRFAILARKRLPASACWQLCDGNECSAPPSPCDSCDWAGPKSVIQTGFEPIHTGRYIARSAHQSLRFPAEIEENYLALCVEREGSGRSNSWIVQPSAWEANKMIVRVPYGGQKWPVWGRETLDMSKWSK